MLADRRFRNLRDDATSRAAIREVPRAHARERDVTMVDADEPGDPLRELRTGEDGAFAYRTVRPAPYGGVAGSSDQHVGVEVFVAGTSVAKDRLGFADDPRWSKRSETPPRWARSVARGVSGIAKVRHEITLPR